VESGNFDEVVLCHMDLVYRMAYRLAGNASDAEDLVQETFLRAHRGFKNFELREYGAKPWLMRILHNVFYTSAAREKKAPTILDDLSLEDFAAELDGEPLPSADTNVIDWEYFDEELKTAVMALSPEYRSVILLWALGDLSYKEIAQVLGCALGTVMSRLYRARQQLGKSLQGYAQRQGVPTANETRS